MATILNELNTGMKDYQSVADQYANYSLEALQAQVKRYESTSATFLEKGNREWAYAKNGLGDHHYGLAKTAYKTAAQNQAKANELKLMLAHKTDVINRKSFVGSTVSGISPAATAAAVGVAVAAVAAVAEGAANGESPAEVARRFAEQACSGAVAGYVSVSTSGVVSLLTGTMPGFLIGATAGYLAGGAALSMARSFSEGLDRAITYHDPVWIPRMIQYGMEDWADDTEEMIGEIGYKALCGVEKCTDTLRDIGYHVSSACEDAAFHVSTVFNVIGGFFDGFF